MDFKQQTGSSILKKFEQFNRDNPVVYDLFKKYAFFLINKRGKKRLSSKLIINRIRWEQYIETTDEIIPNNKAPDQKRYRINDAYTASYARMFCKDFPEHEEKFEMRKLRNAPYVYKQMDLFEIG